MIRAFLGAGAHGAITRLANVLRRTGLIGRWDPEASAKLQPSLTHFIDLNHRAAGPRVRPVGELADALRYIDPDGTTDVLLFSAGSGEG